MDEIDIIRNRLKTYFRMLAVHDPRLGNELVDVLDAYLDAKFKREWQGLTDEEIKDAWSQLWYELGNGKFAASDDPSRHTTIMFAKEIEAKLKEKNSGAG